ncbi:3-oxoadipate enol-lactonase [Pandoraea sp.]|uniref:bifunctional 3-oxoadipate enol-lactonase/4-carboxymuconolactone decarboxylase PcaDC n=1 Tax=Pandoraea sp. TaxID=1883445 RepID=UPI0011F5438D|nr:3-oxoadipate enol-lactonase [Pandoraea sp.]TAL56437.1 MAG: 3-oxoadipate enol-lactonase [Pandoraea sp.]TAM15256.1 MAG: 3-oxoadipate enol-lactonase [Pandoraea sp.]
MPHIQSGTARIYWRADGDAARPALVLGNSLGTDFSLWDPVLPRLMRHFYVVRYDMRGHGASDAPEGDYTLDELTDDLAAVVVAAGLTRFHYCGVSLGGMVGMAYAAREQNRLERLVLCNTSTFFEREVWDTRIAAVRAGGTAAVADAVLARFYTPRFVARGGLEYLRVRDTLLSLAPQGYVGCCAAIRDMRIGDKLPGIAVPTLVLTGAHDQSTPPARGQAIADAIPGARLHTLPCAHIPMTEVPWQWCDTVLDFLDPAPAWDEAARYAAGLARRKQVLGAAYVEQRLAAVTPFNTRFQQLITRLAWGEIWTSSRFEDTARRAMVLAMMTALGRWEEFELHVNAALRAGVEPEVIEETLMQAAVYCGVPAANTAFALAAKAVAMQNEDEPR